MSQESDSKLKTLVKTHDQLKKDLSLTHNKTEEAIKRLQVACEDVKSGFQRITILVCK